MVSDGLGIVVSTVAAVCVLLFIIIRLRAEWLVNLILRAVVGTIVILCVNQTLLTFGYVSGVGVNLWSVLTSGILGIPGVVALYGISFTNYL